MEHKEWKTYRDTELEALMPLLDSLGITLEDEQPHLMGERFLMQAVTTASGRKLILLGQGKDGTRVVVKATRDPKGAEEIRHERACRALLLKIKFAYEVFHSPEELHFLESKGFTISVQRFIEQDSQFIDRPLKEQFSLSLSAFKAQEGTRATTYGHLKEVRRSFGVYDADTYIRAFSTFADGIRRHGKDEGIDELLRTAEARLKEEKDTIEQYTGFLTHTDFVPHNFRVVGDDIYLLDHSSLRFGNKYEGWARFLNFMALYNPELEEALTEYVRINRAPEELRSLTLMRIYRLGEIVWYYTRTLEACEGDLKTLNRSRVDFWAKMLAATLAGERLAPAEIAAYRAMRDSLRSEDEKRRQRELH